MPERQNVPLPTQRSIVTGHILSVMSEHINLLGRYEFDPIATAIQTDILALPLRSRNEIIDQLGLGICQALTWWCFAHIELRQTVFSQLAEHMRLQNLGAKTDVGLCKRIIFVTHKDYGRAEFRANYILTKE
jgi:hypothetical protein